VKVLVDAVSAPVDTDPEVALLPVQAPDAVQLVTFVLDHESVLAPPEAIVVGLAERVMVGTGFGVGVGVGVGAGDEVTETETLPLTVCSDPVPVQSRVKVLVPPVRA
jgi:hypothetical protein